MTSQLFALLGALPGSCCVCLCVCVQRRSFRLRALANPKVVGLAPPAENGLVLKACYKRE